MNPSFTRDGIIVLTEELITWARFVLPHIMRKAEDAHYEELRSLRHPHLLGRNAAALRAVNLRHVMNNVEDLANGLSSHVNREAWNVIVKEVSSHE